MPKASKRLESDLDRLQGTWQVATLEVDGAPAAPGGSISIEGARFITAGMGPAYEGKMSVDETARPKTFDVAFTAGPHKGKKSLGIYEIDGEVWKICLGFAGYSRPAAFATKPGCGHALETLTRGPAVAAKETARETPRGAARPASDDPAMAELSGEWTMVSNVRDGVPLDPQYVKAGRRVVSDGMLTVTVMGQTVLKARIYPDHTQSPMTVDYVMGGPKPVEQLGIYRIEDGVLTTCIAAPGDKRPSEFSSEPGSHRTLSSWRRLKK